jgi:hypothetical protein
MGIFYISISSASLTPNPASTISPSQMLPVGSQPIQTAHVSESASDPISSDDDTPIASIAFEGAAADRLRRSKRDTKGKARAKND